MTTDPGPDRDQDQATAAAAGVCPSCQHRNPTSVKFCQHCGAALSNPCPDCGHINAIWAQHCGSCGVNIQQSKTAGEALREATQHLDRKRYDLAIAAAKRGLATGSQGEKLRKVLQHAQLCGDRLHELRGKAPALIRDGQFEEAERVLTEAIELDSAPDDLRTMLAELPGRSRGRVVDTFLETAARALKELDITAANDSAMRAFKLDNKDPRIIDLLSVLSAKQSRLEALYAQARQARQNKQPAEAAKLAEAVLREWERNDAKTLLHHAREAQAQLNAHLKKAETLLGQGKYTQAQQAFAAALTIQPNPELEKRIKDIRAKVRTRWGRVAAIAAGVCVVVLLLVPVVMVIGDHLTLNDAEARLRANKPDETLKVLHEARVPMLEGGRRARLEKEASDIIGEQERHTKHPMLGIIEGFAKNGNKPGQLLDNSIGMKLAYLPTGEFTMGSPPAEEGRNEDEAPHRVKLAKAFLIATTETTQAQWTAIMGSNASSFSAPTLPVENVSWDDAVDFCRKLSKKEGKVYRLPTEAEWEYACRAGTTTPFSFGTTIDATQANFDGQTPYGKSPKGESRQETMVVTTFPANPWGLHDMHGNVSEWCSDWYDAYPSGAATDPTGPASGTEHVLRGGSWYNIAAYCRSATRSKALPDARNNRIGFRVVMELTE